MVGESSLFGRPTTRSYRVAVAQIVRDLKAAHKLTNEELAERIGCAEDTIRNADREAASLSCVTVLNIAYEFGEQAIERVRALYLCKPAEQPTITERFARVRNELASLEREIAA